MGSKLNTPRKAKNGSVEKPVLRRGNSKLNLPAIDVKQFLSFCETRMAGENVKFYMMLEQYDAACVSSDQNEMNRIGNDIVLQFVSDKSPTQVNFKDSDRQNILKAWEAGCFEVDTFRAARIDIVSALMDGMIPAYEAHLEKNLK